MYVQPALRVDHPYGPMPQMGSGRVKDMGSAQFLRVTHGNYFNPANLSNNAAIYSLAGAASDSTYLKDSSNRLMLVADQSGNSAVNGLVLNGVAANYASAPDSVPLSITGDMDIRFDGAAVDWSPASRVTYVSKFNTTGNQRSWGIDSETNGRITLSYSLDGAATLTASSSVSVGFSDFARGRFRITRNASTGVVTFYTSTDFQNWVQLGDTVAGTAGSLHDSTAVLQVSNFNGSGGTQPYSGIVYRVQIYSGIAGTLAFDANFTAAAKLASSFTESSANAATVTINTSGDLGARICGARDLVQLTQAKQPTFSVSGGYNIATFDGSNDYMKAAPFSLSQPLTTYFVGSQVTFTDGDTVFDGRAGNDMRLLQKTSSPNTRLYAGGAGDTCENTDWAIATKAVKRCVFSGASSSSATNRGASVTGNPGTASPGGFTVGSYGDGTTAFGNVTFLDALVRSVVDDEAMQLRIAGFYIRKDGISA